MFQSALKNAKLLSGLKTLIKERASWKIQLKNLIGFYHRTEKLMGWVSLY